MSFCSVLFLGGLLKHPEDKEECSECLVWTVLEEAH